MTKWDTIQADVKDQYIYIDEQEQEEEIQEDFLGFSKAIQIDHLTDEQLDLISTMFKGEND